MARLILKVWYVVSELYILKTPFFRSKLTESEAKLILLRKKVWILLTLRIALSGEDPFEEDLSKVEENRALKWL